VTIECRILLLSVIVFSGKTAFHLISPTFMLQFAI